MTRHSGGRPRHVLSTYITVLKKTDAGGKDRQCICNSCAEVLKDDAKPMTNRKERIKVHLEKCQYFWTKYGEEAAEIIRSLEEESPPTKYIRVDG
jgi:hypothetical protein